MRTLPTLLFLAVFTLCSLTTGPAIAQTLTPDREAPCDAAVSSTIPLNASSDEAAACIQRTYNLPAADTLALRQDYYDSIDVDVWQGSTIQVETIVVARQATDEAAQADLARITLNQMNSETAQTRLFATGPDSDAPGWWSVRYRLRVPGETALDISSENGGITVRDVVGAHRLQSINGSLAYRLPAGADARFELQTENGTIETDFSVGMRGASHAYLEVVVGRGEPTMRFATTNGNISLQQKD